MGVHRFEDLRVWQAAQRQADIVGELIRRPPFRRDQKLTDELNDASLSVPLNISEGFVRRRTKEMQQFLRYALASNGEVKNCFYAARGRKYLSESETAALIEQNESIAKMLRRFEASLD